MDNKKRIFVNGRFLTQGITGVQRVATELMRFIDQNPQWWAHAYELVLVVPKSIKNLPDYQNVTVVRWGRLGGHLWEQLCLPLMVNKHPLVNICNTAPILSLCFNKKVFVMVHDIAYYFVPQAYSKPFVWFYKILNPFIFRGSKLIFTVSESEKKVIEEKFRTKKSIKVVPNGAIESLIGKKAEEQPKEDVVLYVGSLNYKKNFSGAVQAFIQVAHKYPLLKFFVIGATEGSFSKINIHIPAPLKNRIFFKGKVSDQELFKYYQISKCLLFPSFYEASGIPPTEAMAFGCPVICSNIPALVERCDDAALYANPYDCLEIARKLDELLSNVTLQNELIVRGKKVADNFSWKKSSEIFLKTVLENL